MNMERQTPETINQPDGLRQHTVAISSDDPKMSCQPQRFTPAQRASTARQSFVPGIPPSQQVQPRALPASLPPNKRQQQGRASSRAFHHHSWCCRALCPFHCPPATPLPAQQAKHIAIAISNPIPAQRGPATQQGDDPPPDRKAGGSAGVPPARTGPQVSGGGRAGPLPR